MARKRARIRIIFSAPAQMMLGGSLHGVCR